MEQNSQKRDRSNSLGSLLSFDGSIGSFSRRDNMNGSPFSITLPALGNASPINLGDETNIFASSPTSSIGSNNQNARRNNSPVIVSNSSSSSRGASDNSGQQFHTRQGRAKRNNTSPIYRSSSTSSNSSSNVGSSTRVRRGSNVSPSHTRILPMTTSNNRNENTQKPAAQPKSPPRTYHPIPVRAQQSYRQNSPNIPPYYHNAPTASFPRPYTAAQNLTESQALYLASLIQFVEDGRAVVKHHGHKRSLSANELYNCRPSDILLFNTYVQKSNPSQLATPREVNGISSNIQKTRVGQYIAAVERVSGGPGRSKAAPLPQRSITMSPIEKVNDRHARLRTPTPPPIRTLNGGLNLHSIPIKRPAHASVPYTSLNNKQTRRLQGLFSRVQDGTAIVADLNGHHISASRLRQMNPLDTLGYTTLVRSSHLYQIIDPNHIQGNGKHVKRSTAVVRCTLEDFLHAKDARATETSSAYVRLKNKRSAESSLPSSRRQTHSTKRIKREDSSSSLVAEYQRQRTPSPDSGRLR